LQQGHAIFISGSFKQRMYKPEYEFKISSVNLAENVKRQLTKQVMLEMDVRNVQKETVEFLEKNMKEHPGKAGLRIVVCEPKDNLKISLVTIDNGLEVNNELISFLDTRPEIGVQVITA
jgi:DNA polymerase-3 subunit alpha